MFLPTSFLTSQIVFYAIAAAHIQPRETAKVPDYVNTYAPLIHLDQNELYFPSDIQAHLDNTYAALNYTAITNGPSPLLLSNLDQLNAIGHCDVNDFDVCPLYLTARDDVAKNPSWLYGVLPDPITHETVTAQSCAIIVNDRGGGVVDAFYMYFYAFNLGNTVLGQVIGNHVGDWEHTMVRFKNGKPVFMWFSQHDNGEAYTYEALSKNGTRPIVYSAIGTHANYAVPGTHSRSVASIVINDTTSAGPLWDPTLSAYYYTYTPSSPANGTFIGSDVSMPLSWLSFLGRWGDEQYPDSDTRQSDILNVAWRYSSGPTGPLDKDLNRTEVCPANGNVCKTLSDLPAVSGSSVPITASRSVRASATSKGSVSSTTRGSSTGGSGSLEVGLGIVGMAVVAAGIL